MSVYVKVRKCGFFVPHHIVLWVLHGIVCGVIKYDHSLKILSYDFLKYTLIPRLLLPIFLNHWFSHDVR